MKLNLGCFNKKIYGFTNVDCREDVKPDVVDDIVSLTKFEDNSADLIVATHVLEHVKRVDALKALKRWFSVLKKGGILRVAVPNIEEACKHYIYHKDLSVLHSIFWGSQFHDYDFHHTGWDFDTLSADLVKTGFIDVKIYDPWAVEEGMVDSYAKSYLPTCNIEFKHGKATPLNRCISLNIECIKG
jgi:predicted SAM-dependent methyltransferase